MSSPVRIGTCSWADKGLIEEWYPPTAKSAEARLRYYAERFDTVEVNSSYYAIPAEQNAARWAERTPPGFVFHVKAFGLMTGHKVKPEQLPADLRPLVEEVTRYGNVVPGEELRRRVFERFHRALEPLRAADRMGAVLMQYPPSFLPGPEAFATLEEHKELLGGDEMLVEFRHRDWLAEERRGRVLDWLEAHGMTYVSVDEPQGDFTNVLPPVAARTSATAYVRFHGRNAATWNANRTGYAGDRFDHYYAEQELAEWVPSLRSFADAAKRVFALFNTNNHDQGPENAALLQRLLVAAGVPVSRPEPPAERAPLSLF